MTKSEILRQEEKFRYQLLSRLQADCEYYLGNGQRHEKHLWANSKEEHIEYMELLWSSFSDDKKPEWISLGDIKNYKRRMF